MDFKDLRNKALLVLEPSAQKHNFELVDVALSGSTKNPTLTVFLDNGGENTLEQLAPANEWVEEEVEKANLFEGGYILEISSPGINRPLRTLKDFERFARQKAEIKIAAEKGERSLFKGTLAGVEDGTILIETENGLEKINYEQVIKAHLHVDIDFKSLKGTKDNG